MNRNAAALVALTGLVLLGPAQAGDPTRIAAAADLRFAMDEIVEHYQRQHPDDEIEVIYGSSGRFHSQIANGAPYDLYFSADIAYPESLHDSGFVHGDVIPYAIGRVVIWSNTVDAEQLRLSDLDDEGFRRVAIANPSHAPYGERAREALQTAGTWEAVESRLVFGENISHALQLIETGAAEVGIIALSLARSPQVQAQGGYHLIDDDQHAPLLQGFVVTEHAADNEVAHRFAEFMDESKPREIMESYGFMHPDS